MINYSIEIVTGSQFVGPDDLHRAEHAIDAALAREGIETTEQLSAALDEYVKRSECETCDDQMADRYERIVSAGDIALTEGWGDPNGASLSIGVK